MSLLDTTLVVRGDVAAAQADVLATSVSNAATSGELMIQVDGAFADGDDSAAASDAMIKLSVAVPQPDGSTAVMGTSEFKKSQIISSDYKAPRAGSAARITVSNLQSGMNSIRLEAQDGINVHDVLGVTGKDAAELVANFNDRPDTARFDNVTLEASGSDVRITITPRGYDITVTGDDALTVTYNTANTVGRRGQRDNVIDLETRSYISAGAYNQVEFPVVVPATSTEFDADYGIYTIEVLQALPGNRRAIETIRVAIKDDEAASNKLVNAIQTILGLSGVDVTPPAALTSIQFVTDATGSTDAATAYSEGSASAMFVKIAGAEVGATITVTLTVDGGDDVVETFTASAASEVLSLTVTADNYAEDDVVSVNATQTDTAGNVSATTTADTATIQA